MAQLVEQSLPIPEVRGLNPVIGKYLYIEHLFTVSCVEKTKIKKNEAEMVQSLAQMSKYKNFPIPNSNFLQLGYLIV